MRNLLVLPTAKLISPNATKDLIHSFLALVEIIHQGFGLDLIAQSVLIAMGMSRGIIVLTESALLYGTLRIRIRRIATRQGVSLASTAPRVTFHPNRVLASIPESISETGAKTFLTTVLMIS